MAALDDSLTKFQGKKWSNLTDKTGFHNLLNNQNSEENVKQRRRSSASCLRKEEMDIYGYCPVWENFYLVVCDLCGLSVKPQALRHHIEIRHGGVQLVTSKLCSTTTTTTTTTSCNSYSKYSAGKATVTTSASFCCNITSTTSTNATSNSSCSSSRRTKDSNRNSLQVSQSSMLLNSRLSNPTLTSAQSSHLIHPSHVPPAVITPQTPPTPPATILPSGAPASTITLTSSSSYSGILTSTSSPPITQFTTTIFSQNKNNGGKVNSSTSAAAPPMSYTDSSMRISLPTVLHSSSTLPISSSNNNKRSASRCSNSTLSNNLDLCITNGLDFSESENVLPERGSQNRAIVSPLLDFPVTLSKEEEESFDNRLQVFSSPHQSNDSNNLIQNNRQSVASQLTDLPAENSLLSPSPQSIGVSNLGSNILNNMGPLSAQSIDLHSVGPHSIEPQSVGPPSVGPPSVNPPSIGSTNPPSVGASNPPSVRSVSQSSIGASNVGLQGVMGSGAANMNMLHSGVMLPSENLLNGSGSSSHLLPTNLGRQNDGEAEAVSRISAMLQQEAEAITASNLLDQRPGSNSGQRTNSLNPHGLIENQSLSRLPSTLNATPTLGPDISNRTNNNNNSLQLNNMNSSNIGHEIKGNMPSISSLNSLPASVRQVNEASNHLGSSNQSGTGVASVPLQMSVETLNQIHTDLLATVSESDLNAVLNATPDSAVLPNNSEVFFQDNATVQFADSSILNSESNFDQSLQLNNRSAANFSQQNFNAEQVNLSVLDASNDQAGSSSHSASIPLDNLLLRDHSSSHRLSLSEVDKISQSDELTNAVNSITEPAASTSFESPMSGFLQNVNQAHVVSSPLTSPSPSISVSSVGIPAASPLSVSNNVPLTPLQSATNVHDMAALGQKCVTSQGITVVFGGKAPQITTLPPQSPLSTLNSSNLKKSSSASAVLPHSRLVSQNISAVAVPQQSPVQTVSSSSNVASHAGGTLVTQVNPPPPQTTPSPKKSSKKKKLGEHRKIVPLKDREYNPEIHCGVVVSETGKPCTRSLTCKTHSLSLRRAVNSRSKKFDDLLMEHKANKEASNKAAKASEAHSLIQGNATSMGSRGVPHVTSAPPSSSSATSSPILVRSLGGGGGGAPAGGPVVVPPGTPSPLSTAGASPYLWPAAGGCSTTPLVRPTLVHADNFYVSTAPAPQASCTYNVRRVGGYLTSEHKTDLLRSVFRMAIKKPSTSSFLTEVGPVTPTISSLTGAPSPMPVSAVAERLNNVKPLLARKLQATGPLPPNSMTSKDGITVGTGYNGHIQVATNSIGIVQNAQLKRSLHHLDANAKATALTFNKAKTKKAKIENGPTALNILSNVVQLDASGTAKNHSIPVVAVSIANGLSTPQTINLSNVNLSNMRTSNNQPIRIHPSSLKTVVRQDQLVGDVRTSATGGTTILPHSSASSGTAIGQTITTEGGTNLVFGSGLPGGATSLLIADGVKSIKTDSSGSIRFELHGNTFTDSRFIHATSLAKVVTSNAGASVVASQNNTLSLSNAQHALQPQQQVQQSPQQQQVTYLTTPTNCATSANQPFTLQVQHVLNRLQSKGGGLKLLAPPNNSTRATTAPHRTAYVLQQDNQPS